MRGALTGGPRFPTVPAMRRLVPGVLILLATGPAVAVPAGDQLRVDGELGYACFHGDRRHHGVEAGAELAWVFDPFWALRGGYTFGQHLGKGENFRVHRIGAGVRYQLDVFEYVPWIEVSGGLFVTTGTGGPAALDGAVGGGLGFDWLMNEAWSLGVATRYDRLFGEPLFPAYLTVGLRVGYRWEPGDPFAP